MEFKDTMGILIYIVFLIIGFCASLIAHELGHLICGCLSGYRFISFRIMKWLWTKDESGNIKFTKGTGLTGTGGQCLMEPSENEKNFQFWLYNAGGGLVNFIIGIAFMILFFLVHNDYVKQGLLGLGLPAIMLGAANLIPMKAGGIPNDGENIKEAKKSADAKHSLYMMFKVNAEMSKGKLLADYEEGTFTVSEQADINNFLVAQMLLLHAGQLEESCDYNKSYQLLSRPKPEKLPPFYSGQLLFNLMFHELVYFGDESSVQRSRDRIEAKSKDKIFLKLLTMKHPAFIPFHAAKTAFLDHDTDKARELIVEARELNPTQQNPGLEHSVTLMLDKLESRMEASICDKTQGSIQ